MLHNFKFVDELDYQAVGAIFGAGDGATKTFQLRKVSAAVRFISAEPLLGPLDGLCLDGIDWLIAGGESGPHARDCRPEWVRSARDICQAEGVAFFFKQWGTVRASGRGKGGHDGAILDGRRWTEMPA